MTNQLTYILLILTFFIVGITFGIHIGKAMSESTCNTTYIQEASVYPQAREMPSYPGRPNIDEPNYKTPNY